MSIVDLSSLNDEQKDAVITTDGYVKVLAGAGTGKTKTLVSRTAYLLDQGVNPANILLITFTKKAAQEMRERIKAMLQDDRADKIIACTFHALAAELLRVYGVQQGYVAPDFQILNSRDAEDIMKMYQKPTRDAYLAAKKKALQEQLVKERCSDAEIKKKLKECSLDGFPTAKNLLEIKSIAFNHLINVDEANNRCFEVSQETKSPLDDTYKPDAKKIITSYETYKNDKGYVDYDDLLMRFYQLLKDSTDVREYLDNRYQYIMCDEYQDTNIIQDEIINLLSKDVANVCIVGDDNQSIYKFRGAVIDNIISFDKRHTPCKTIKLVQNYRSTQEILDLANSVMSFALEGARKDLISAGKKRGEKPTLSAFTTTDEEARFIVNKMKSIMKDNPKLTYKDFAVIARAGRQTFAVEKELNLNKMPFRKFGGVGFFDLECVNMVLSFIKVHVNIKQNKTDKDIDWFRTLSLVPGIGAVNAKKIYEEGIVKEGIEYLVSPAMQKKSYAEGLTDFYKVLKDSLNVTKPVELVAGFSEYYKRSMTAIISARATTDEKRRQAQNELAEEVRNLKALTEMSMPYTSVNVMLDDFVLNTPAADDEEDYITISTIHSVKGLEFHTVFFIDPVMGVIPHTEQDLPDTREDLRCVYVALTRAKEILYITYARFSMGQEQALSCHLNKQPILDCCNVERHLTARPDYSRQRYNSYSRNYY